MPSTKDTYNQISEQFSASRSRIWPDLKPYLQGISPGSSVLDLGCGNGRLLLGLPAQVNYLGIDQSSSLLEKAKEFHPKNKFVEGDILSQKTWEKLPQYDYIFCIAVLHHLSTYSEHLFVLQQIKNHLKPNGKVLLTVWNLWQPKYLKYHFTTSSLNLKHKTKNIKALYIPFQGVPRFHFAYTTPYLKKLISSSDLNLFVKKTSHNYLIHS